MNEKATPARGLRKGGKFNFIDFLLVLVILLIIAALVYVFLPTSWIKNITADDTVELQYTIEFKGVDEEFINNIKGDDSVLDSVSKTELGTVTAVDYSARYSELTYDNETQAGVLAYYPGKYNILVTISATADYIEGEGYSVNGTRIAIGEKLSARFPNYLGEGYCILLSVE